MPVQKEKIDRILDYIINFAGNYQYLRIVLENRADWVTADWVAQYNLGPTGATSMGLDFEELTLADLQKLPSVSADNGLPFNTIHFRTGDSGPGLANIQFQKGRFEVHFLDKNDPLVITFCEELNAIIGNQEQLDALQNVTSAVGIGLFSNKEKDFAPAPSEDELLKDPNYL